MRFAVVSAPCTSQTPGSILYRFLSYTCYNILIIYVYAFCVIYYYIIISLFFLPVRRLPPCQFVLFAVSPLFVQYTITACQCRWLFYVFSSAVVRQSGIFSSDQSNRHPFLVGCPARCKSRNPVTTWRSIPYKRHDHYAYKLGTHKLSVSRLQCIKYQS